MVWHLLGPLLSRQWVCIIAYDACNVGRHSEKSKKKNQTRSDSPTQRRRMAKHDSYCTQWHYADRQEHDIIMSSASRTPLRRCPEKVPSAARHERRATHVVARLLLLIFLLLVLPIRTARPSVVFCCGCSSSIASFFAGPRSFRWWQYDCAGRSWLSKGIPALEV